MHLKSKRSNHPKSKNLFLLFIYLLIFTNGCKKETSTGEPNAQIDQLKNWYENNNKNFNQSSKIFAGLKPDFDHSYTAIHNGECITELNFDSPNKLVFAPGNVDEQAKEKLMANTVVKLLLFNSPGSKEVKGAYMVLIAENGKLSNVHYKNYADFSGSLRFYNLDGSFQNGYDLKNGKITRTLSKPDKTGMDLINLNDNSAVKSIRENAKPGDRLMLFNANGDCNLVSSNTYGYVCVSIENSPEIPTHCYLQQTGSDTYIACSDDSPGNDAVYTGTGGITTGTGVRNTASVREIIDSVQNSCIKVQLVNSLTAKTTIKDMLNEVFSGTIQYESLNLVFKDVANLPDTISGDTKRWSATNTDFEIRLNQNKLPNYSQEYILSTIYHEILHAYMLSKLTVGTDGRYNISTQHEDMANKYVILMTGALKIAFPNISDQEAWGLSWGGLENTNLYKTKLTEAQREAINETNRRHTNKSVTNRQGTYCN